MSDAGAWLGFFLGGWGTSFSGYLLLQGIALSTLKRSFWIAALTPLIGMLVVVGVTVQAFRQQSNMWPMLMILASPLALLIVAAIEVAGVKAQAHPRQQFLTLVTLAVVVAIIAFEAYVFLVAA
jgi:hypothetical protein